ncbi:MAG TPA: hypothetical protein DCO77_11540 [Nitrospiraceae bacterium]|nr:hypothetical protein [Nitrospiraceae bacterium]
MNWSRLLYFFVTFIPLVAVGCGPSMQQVMQKEIMKSTSLSAYQRNEQQVHGLQPGVNIQEKITWDFYRMQNQGKSKDFVVADGWIGRLSGQYHGGVFGFGQVNARSGDTVFGEHVFGYLLYGITLVPKYSVIMQAELISFEEYKALVKAKKTGTIGWFRTPGWKKDAQPKEIPQAIHFKNATIQEVRTLDVAGEDIEGVTIAKAGSLTEVVKSYLTRERFQKAQKKLKKVKAGSTPWDVIAALNGKYMTPNSGLDYLLLMDGFLMYNKEGPWQKMTKKGYYVVWPFGYLENETEMAQLDLIFKNGKLHKLVKHEPKESIERQYID